MGITSCYVNDEHSKLVSVVVGIGNSWGPTPSAEDAVDPKSREHILAGTYPNEADFECGGLSRVLDIVARTVYIQQIEIQNGWGMYSTFIAPEDPSLDFVLEGIVDNLTIMKDELGNVYWPLLGINNIGSLTDGDIRRSILNNSNFFINKIIKDLSNHDRCIVSTKLI